MTARWAMASRLALVALGLASAAAAPAPRQQADTKGPVPPLSVRITSPLGRVGVSTTVRIVAQVHTADEKTVPTVRFLVDGTLIKVDDDGPPYAAEWVDDSPFLEREIVVQAADQDGHAAKDSVTLNAYEFVDFSQVRSMLLETAVYDKKGRFVSGLEPADFSVRENGTLQKLDLVSPETVPATFALLIDSSQSMLTRVDFVRLAARRLAPYLRPIDRVVVAPFSIGLGAITGPTDDQATMEEAIGAIRPKGGTAILESLSQMAQQLNGVEGRRVIILITDGYDENSAQSVDATLKGLLAAQTTVYVVGIGGISGVSLKGQVLLRRLAAETGGKAFFPWGERDLPAAYDLLATNASNRYLLAYTPADNTADGKWRAIEVLLRPTDLVVQTRAGYFAPKPPPIRPEIEFTVADSAFSDLAVSADDLYVLEDGVEQKIDTFHEAVAPVSIVLALDASGSMRLSAQAATDAARGFIKALRPTDALSVALFADQAVFVHDFSTKREQSFDAINTYIASGGTALYDTVAGALARVRRVEARRAVVVVTDGRDEDNPGTGPGSAHTLDEVVLQAMEARAVVFGVGIGSKVDRKPLEELARISGGQAYFPTDAAALSVEYQRIVENLRRRWVVSYPSTNPARDGVWRKVEIRVRSTNLLVTSAGGYFAPEK